jgi:hypothetical protein
VQERRSAEEVARLHADENAEEYVDGTEHHARLHEAEPPALAGVTPIFRNKREMTLYPISAINN